MKIKRSDMVAIAFAGTVALWAQPSWSQVKGLEELFTSGGTTDGTSGPTSSGGIGIGGGTQSRGTFNGSGTSNGSSGGTNSGTGQQNGSRPTNSILGPSGSQNSGAVLSGTGYRG